MPPHPRITWSAPNDKTYLFRRFSPWDGIGAFFRWSLSPNKVLATNIRVLLNAGFGKAFTSAGFYPFLTFVQLTPWLREPNEKYTFHVLPVGVPGITVASSIATVLCRDHFQPTAVRFGTKNTVGVRQNRTPRM